MFRDLGFGMFRGLGFGMLRGLGFGMLRGFGLRVWNVWGFRTFFLSRAHFLRNLPKKCKSPKGWLPKRYTGIARGFWDLY